MENSTPSLLATAIAAAVYPPKTGATPIDAVAPNGRAENEEGEAQRLATSILSAYRGISAGAAAAADPADLEAEAEAAKILAFATRGRRA